MNRGKQKRISWGSAGSRGGAEEKQREAEQEQLSSRAGAEGSRVGA
jgi:hypothetical protein